jgi:hypothetical protein
MPSHGSNPESVELWNICQDLADWESSKIVLWATFVRKSPATRFFGTVFPTNHFHRHHRPEEVPTAALAVGSQVRDGPEGLRDNFGTFEKWESAAFSGVSDTNKTI